LPPLPSDSHKYFTGLMPFVVEHANDFDLLSAFQRRNRRRGDAEGTKRKLQLFFEMGVPPAESLGFVPGVLCQSSTWAWLGSGPKVQAIANSNQATLQ
jgi:hypothetical protein